MSTHTMQDFKQFYVREIMNGKGLLENQSAVLWRLTEILQGMRFGDPVLARRLSECIEAIGSIYIWERTKTLYDECKAYSRGD